MRRSVMRAIKPTFLYHCSFALLIAMACAGCSSLDVKQAKESGSAAKKTAPRVSNASLNKGERDLQRGIQSYEEAAYETAEKQFHAALDRGLAARKDRANAYKYLAFVACTSGREKTCLAEFRKAFEADPKFKLTAAEAGHPVWGPVFRSVEEQVATKTRAR